MNAFALHQPGDRTALRWTGSALAIIAVHAGLIAAGIALYQNHAPPGAAEATIMIDMAPVSAAPTTQPLDVAPGPERPDSEAPSATPPEPQPQQQVEQMIPATPQVEKAEVVAPPEQKAEPTPPEPEKVVTTEPPKPPQVKPKPIKAEVKKEKPKDTKFSQRSAPQRAERIAPATSASTAGASQAAANYKQLVQAHVRRFQQYPSGSRSGQAGKVTALVSFTLSRSGQVVAARLASSSGRPALDAEAVATIRRANPFPPFPPEKTEGSTVFTVPLAYNLTD
jgi:periplasmic protein TonB